MKTIYKYELTGNGDFSNITIIKADIIQILHIDLQGSIPVLWAEVDTEGEPFPTQITRVGTGWNIEQALPHEATYIGSVV